MTGRAALIGLANALVLATAFAAIGLSSVERALFVAVHDLPLVVHLPLLVVTPLGSGVAALLVPAIAGLADRALALRLLMASSTAWLAAQGLKSAVDRPRPAGLLEDVVTSVGAGGTGYPSGHAAVAVALAAALWPDLGGRGRRVVGALAALVALARIEQGVHLPLDTLGGLTIGLLTAAIARRATSRRVPTKLSR